MKEELNLIRLHEAMDLLQISRATIDRWRKEKQLPHIKIGKEIWIDKEQLQQWIQEHAISSRSHVPLSRETEREQVVVVGYQSGAALLWSSIIMKQLGLFEEELRLLNPYTKTNIRWVDAPNGMELIEKQIAGQVHIASVGDYPIMASRTLSRILPGYDPQVLAFDGKAQSGEGIALVVPSTSTVRYSDELTSSSISIVGGSSSSYRLKEWVGTSGLGSEPVIHRGMSECINGIMEGRVGASILWEPYLSWVQAIGAGVPLQMEGIGTDYLTGLVADGKWIQHNPTIVIAYLKAHLRAHAFIRREPERAARLIHSANGFPLSLIHAVLSRIRWDASFYSRDLRALSNDQYGQMDWLSAHKRSTGGLEFQKQHLQEAAEALQLPPLPDLPLQGEWSCEVIY
ncbi:helix-turn-helix domain-containing protein [Paenibacillus paeoniae]|uniref:Helix-turn-helix domain-containing protein n=1 Tax=Paenibacillus paeoniae TaxID=2292705 RepID=A0A371PJZ0_9BACL|nr:helix-turn-helix domain-containing protein [Paenibacillus paeoniae]REK75969.1 helix-turn-helix domain-containing protein [Paenibacillus paeoniae]